MGELVRRFPPPEFYVSEEAARRDVAGILQIQGRSLDRGYIARWAPRLGVEAIWRRISGQVHSVGKKPEAKKPRRRPR